MSSRYMTTPQNLRLLSAMKAKSLLKKYKIPIALLFLHAPLGLFLHNSGGLAAIHAYAVFFYGLSLAVRKQKSIEKVALVAAYIVGSEVLWRMAHAPIYWEFGKYAAGLIMLVALTVRGNWKIPSLPLVYFICLVPGCLMTLLNNNLSDAKDKLSFNMSGPFLLFVCCWFFSHVRINSLQLRKLFFWLIVPLFSVGFTTLFYTVTTENIQFTSQSNFMTSGGFGPNQVSSLLGLGAFISLVVYLLFKNRFKEKIYFSLLAIFLAGQSVMTFSRGGIYNAAGAVAAVLFFQMRDGGKGIKHIFSIGILVTVFLVAIFPQMDQFTGGTLKNRFLDTEPTRRVAIIESDFQIFMENPAFGIGVGESNNYREKFFHRQAISHTEFSRLVSEHGIFGIFAVFTLGLMFISSIKSQESSFSKAVVAGCMAWSTLFMLNTGMRLFAPAFMWGLGFIILTGLNHKKRNIRLLENKSDPQKR